jgi:hypothetical protein
MRFNPPPTWPQPPAGWTPPPGWQPDLASLPPLPDGWVLWLPDDAPAGATAPAAPWPTSVPPASAGFLDPAAFGVPDGPTREAALQARRSATRWFWIAVAVLVGATVSTILASGDGGGFIWTGGFLVGVTLVVRAAVAYRDARRSGAPAYSVRGWLAAAGGAAAVTVAGVVAVTAYVSPGSVMPHVATGVGSCWVVDGSEYLTAVDCGGAHEYTAVEQVAVLDTCPLEAIAYVEAEDDGYLCLEADA